MNLNVIIILIVSLNVIPQSTSGDEDYVDRVIDMLLNGVSVEVAQSDENNDGQEPELHGGIWKCGVCDDLDESRLMYSEDNDVDADMVTDGTVDVQIGFTVQDMRCVTVTADESGIVRRVSGSCTGSSVTLHVAPVKHFTIKVYK